MREIKESSYHEVTSIYLLLSPTEENTCKSQRLVRTKFNRPPGVRINEVLLYRVLAVEQSKNPPSKKPLLYSKLIQIRLLIFTEKLEYYDMHWHSSERVDVFRPHVERREEKHSKQTTCNTTNM